MLRSDGALWGYGGKVECPIGRHCAPGPHEGHFSHLFQGVVKGAAYQFGVYQQFVVVWRIFSKTDVIRRLKSVPVALEAQENVLVAR